MSSLTSDGQRRPDREDEPGPQGLENRSDLTASRRRTPIAERVSSIVFSVFILAIPGYLIAVAVELNVLQPHRSAFHIDFVAFWAAAKLAVAGQAVSAFDPQTLFAAQSLLPEDDVFSDLFWLYPPGFHLLLMPLGYLGFSPALAIFTVCGGTLYYFGLRGWTRGIPVGLHLAFVAPPVAFVLATGNASLLWTGILLLGLTQLFRQNALGAGVMIALLTLKPQLGIMIPVALIAAGYWRTVIWASVATAVIVAITLAAFGIEYWSAFFESMLTASETAASHLESSKTMITWYAFFRHLGSGHDTALAIQLLWLIAAMGVVVYLWRLGPGCNDLKIAGLCLAILVSTPYAYQYELVLGVIAALFLLRAGSANTIAGRLWMGLLWMLPVPGWQIVGLEIAHYAVPVLTLALGYVTLLAHGRAHSCHRTLEQG